ncbi:hypothetical protein D3C81_2124430 [compost metagenome]
MGAAAGIGCGVDHACPVRAGRLRNDMAERVHRIESHHGVCLAKSRQILLFVSGFFDPGGISYGYAFSGLGRCGYTRTCRGCG